MLHSFACFLLAVIASQFSEASAVETLNRGAAKKAARIAAWKELQPTGCKAGDGRWCEIHDDGSVTLRNFERLEEIIGLGVKRLQNRDDTDHQFELETTAGKAMKLAVLAANKKFGVSEKQRLKKSKTKQARLPSTYRCRKNSKKKDVEQLEYQCTVTDYTFKIDESSSASSAGKSSLPVISDEDRCFQLRSWLSNYKRDGSDEKTEFWRWLTKHHTGFAEIVKLKDHSKEHGTGTGKVQNALESKAVRLYKELSKEIHPDKLGPFFKRNPDCGSDDVKEMLRATFDRVSNLKICVLKPLRCSIREEQKDEL